MNTQTKIVDILSPEESRCSTFAGDKETSIKTWRDFCVKAGIGEIFHDAKLADVKEIYLTIYHKIYEWAAMKPRPNLILRGGVGSGKTHTAFAIMRALWESGNKWCRYITSQQIIEIGEEKGISYLKEVFGEAGILFVDDLGVEKAADWQIKYYFELFNTRFNSRLPTIITSNFDVDGLSKMLTQRVTSRLHGVEIMFPSEDLRKMF